MTARTDLVWRLAKLVGPSLQIEEVQKGWPALATVHIAEKAIPLALFLSGVGSSHRNREDTERRFQNPAGSTPLVEIPGRLSVLAGLWESDSRVAVPTPLIVTADASRRADGRTTRWSVFAPLATLEVALSTGWATHISDSGELIRGLHPVLLPAAVAADAAGVDPSEPLMRTAIGASGLLEDAAVPPDAPPAERARRAATSLVRDAKFSARVLEAYEQRCAMCGLGLSLVQGAHIYPASAPGAADEPWNGLALCGNHHLAFDRHIIGVRTPRMDVVFHPDVLAHVGSDATTKAFVERTSPVLRPATPGGEPQHEMFARRYEYYGDKYDWLLDP